VNETCNWTNVTTGSTANTGTYVMPITLTTSPAVVVGGAGGGGGGYFPLSFAEDDLAWLRRRVREVTGLFPAAA
jgi:hypothetical protein